MEQKTYQYREVIFTEGQYQSWMYSICKGSVDIFSGYGTSDEKKLITLTEGQFFGEIGMMAVMSRTATAVAAADHVVLEQIGHEDLEDYLKNHPENLQPVMSSVSRRIRELTDDLSMITQMINEALGKRGKGTGWLAGSIHKLLGKLKAKKTADDEFAIMRKRQQALSGEIPPVIRFHAGDVIFRAGDQADCMYDIYDGSVGIYSDYQTENEKLLASLNADDTFGEMGILDDMPRSASAVCLSDCAVRVVKPESFMAFFQQKPAKVLQILMQMCIRLRDLTKLYLQVNKELEQLPAAEETDSWEDEAYSRLEHIRYNQLCTSIYDISGCAEWFYEYD
jgi:CRP-like cAMP-binding protein